MFRFYFTLIDSFMGSQIKIYYNLLQIIKIIYYYYYNNCNLLKTSYFLQNHHRKLCSKEDTNGSRCITLELWLQRVLWKTIKTIILIFTSVQFSSVAQSSPAISDPVNCSTPGLPVHHQPPESTQTLVHWVGNAVQTSHPLLSPSSPALQSFPESGSFQMRQLFALRG